MDRLFTIDEARSLLSELRPEIDELITVRAELTENVHAHRTGDDSVPLADVKGLEARLSELVDGFGARGIEVKGWAPLLLDFPSRLGNRDLLLCWVEGETGLYWYHDVAHGFAGRRPLDDLEK